MRAIIKRDLICISIWANNKWMKRFMSNRYHIVWSLTVYEYIVIRVEIIIPTLRVWKRIKEINYMLFSQKMNREKVWLITNR